MKKILFVLFLGFGTLSCSSFLEEENLTYATAENYYTSAERIRTGLNGLYDPARSIYGATFFLLSEASTDVIFLSSYTRPDANCVISPSKPGHGATVWRQGYLGVMRCNEMCKAADRALEKGQITASEHTVLFAESSVMRAFYYYVLTSVFGDVPFYTEVVTEENRADIASLPRTSADEIRDYLIAELEREFLGGKPDLPLVRSYDEGTDYHAGAALGLILGGKFCLWNERWDDAIRFFGVLEDIYGHYADSPEAFGADYSLSDIPFRHKWIAESIFETSNRVQDYGIQEYCALASYVTPYRSATSIVPEDDEDSDVDASQVLDIYNGIAIPELGKYARTYKAARPTKYFYNELMTYTGADLRSGEYSAGSDTPRGGSGNLAWRWVGYDPSDTERSSPSVRWFADCKTPTSRPWLGDKFWCPGMMYNRDGNNIRIFRFAGALLGMAEAQLMAGDIDSACKYLNITRTRAGLDPVSPDNYSYSQDAVLEEIRKECARELFGEFQRKFDLVRWGIWYERTLQYNNSYYLPMYIKPYHKYYPIPADQVTYSGGALDNKDYVEQ